MVFRFRKRLVVGKEAFMAFSHKKEHVDYFGFDDTSFSLMQSTGLFDAEGKEVYEEDIIDMDGLLYVVLWDARHAQMVIRHGRRCVRDQNDRINEAVVVGNTYEHEDLLMKVR